MGQNKAAHLELLNSQERIDTSLGVRLGGRDEDADDSHGRHVSGG